MTQTLSLRGAPFRVKWELVECDEQRFAHWHGKGPAGSEADTEYQLSETPAARCSLIATSSALRSACSDASRSAP